MRIESFSACRYLGLGFHFRVGIRISRGACFSSLNLHSFQYAMKSS